MTNFILLSSSLISDGHDASLPGENQHFREAATAAYLSPALAFAMAALQLSPRSAA
jgi:hypothetical protein